MQPVGERDPAVSRRGQEVGFIGSRRPEIFQSTVAVALIPTFWIQGSLWQQEFTWVIHGSLALGALGIAIGGILNLLWRDELKAVSLAYRTIHSIVSLAVGLGSFVFIAAGPLDVVQGTLVAASVLAVYVGAWIAVGPAFRQVKSQLPYAGISG